MGGAVALLTTFQGVLTSMTLNDNEPQKIKGFSDFGDFRLRHTV